jgi:hypothetical protein
VTDGQGVGEQVEHAARFVGVDEAGEDGPRAKAVGLGRQIVDVQPQRRRGRRPIGGGREQQADVVLLDVDVVALQPLGDALGRPAERVERGRFAVVRGGRYAAHAQRRVFGPKGEAAGRRPGAMKGDHFTIRRNVRA